MLTIDPKVMNMHILKGLGRALLVSCLSSLVMAESLFITQLDGYGKKVAASAKLGVFKYAGSEQTMSTPLVSYVMKFQTSDSGFRSRTDATTNKEGYVANSGRRMVWETKFCTPELREMMQKSHVNIVNGDLSDNAGRTQFLATCTRY
jgi:hypothetical protein